MRAIRTSVGILVVAALAFVPVACSDDDTTPASSDGTTTEEVDRPGDQVRDRDRDRDRIHQAMEDVLGACQDQDRDRLRDRTGDTWRFRWSDVAGWVLSELPATIDSSDAPSTTL